MTMSIQFYLIWMNSVLFCFVRSFVCLFSFLLHFLSPLLSVSFSFSLSLSHVPPFSHPLSLFSSISPPSLSPPTSVFASVCLCHSPSLSLCLFAAIFICLSVSVSFFVSVSPNGWTFLRQVTPRNFKVWAHCSSRIAIPCDKRSIAFPVIEQST